MQRAELGTGLACAGERKDICWRSPGRNGGMEQRHLPAFETGRAGKGQKLCAGYCPLIFFSFFVLLLKFSLLSY
ncbi:hypothetical protein cco5_03646 [Campylobacter coli 132-6]|nr:hypothetical protein cco5_03646 [Campylobacter coli 132-6]KRS92002.1 hypothetical protein DB08_01165 [Campylobacter coli]